MFTAIRRASSSLSNLAAERRPARPRNRRKLISAQHCQLQKARLQFLHLQGEGKRRSPVTVADIAAFQSLKQAPLSREL
jgi:hypothetical protein